MEPLLILRYSRWLKWLIYLKPELINLTFPSPATFFFTSKTSEMFKKIQAQKQKPYLNCFYIYGSYYLCSWWDMMETCRIAAFMPMCSRIYLPFSAQQCFCAKRKHINLYYQNFWSCKRVLQIWCMFPMDVFAWTWHANIQGTNTICNTFKVFE